MGRPRFLKRITLAAFWLAAVSLSVASAQSASEIVTDEDELFSDETIQTSVPETVDTGIGAALTRASVSLGGRFSGGMGISWRWDDPWTGSSGFLSPETTTVTAKLSSLVRFEGRPDEDFRVLGSFAIDWPFPSATPTLSVFELFSDFVWKDTLFFRFGKSTAKWGTGYFWSPADVINVGSIDFTDPEAQREGPVHLRVHYPVPRTQHNFYGYAILRPKGGERLTVSDIALAAKGELLLGRYELGLGALYQHGRPERGMLTIAGPLGDFDLFGELALSRGSEKLFISSLQATPPYVVPAAPRTDPVLSGTAGLVYADMRSKFTAVAQYFLNGEGYADADREALVTSGMALLGTPGLAPQALAAIGQALPGIAFNSGTHYAGLSVSKTDFLVEDVTLSALSIVNLSDTSGFVRPSVSWKLFDRLTLQADLTFVFGPMPTEYGILFTGNPIILGLSAKLGSGSF